jgi:hypothetical protein
MLLSTGSLAASPQGDLSTLGKQSRRRNRPSVTPGESSESVSRKQQKELIAHRFEQMKQDADELTTLARSLQEDLDKTSENILSLQILEKAEKIEKLAKRIKNNAKG